MIFQKHYIETVTGEEITENTDLEALLDVRLPVKTDLMKTTIGDLSSKSDE